MIRSDFHIHTAFCDGRDTPEEMVTAALEKGFTAIGFSGHSYTEPDAAFAMHPQKAAAYRQTIRALKEKYRGKIEIFCGIEQDILSADSTVDYDYVIGSVHYVSKGGEWRSVDDTAQTVRETVSRLYGNDFDAYAEDYFALVSGVVRKTGCDIIGHFDLVSKFNEANGTRQSARFLAAAEKAVAALVPLGKPFEINTGAMARVGRPLPYPSPEILRIIRAHGGRILFSSDCHDRRYLGYAFDDAEKLAAACGFTERGIVTGHGIEYIPI